MTSTFTLTNVGRVAIGLPPIPDAPERSLYEFEVINALEVLVATAKVVYEIHMLPHRASGYDCRCEAWLDLGDALDAYGEAE